jgi:hypothetical protein
MSKEGYKQRTVEPQNNEPQNVEGMYSVYFIKRKQRMTEDKEDKNYDLEDRLINFSVRIIRMAESPFVTAQELQKKPRKNSHNRISGSNQPYCV